MKRAMLTGCGFFAFCVCAITAAADVVFDDGLAHDIDYAVAEAVYVRDAADGASSRINVSDGAAMSSQVTLEGRSYLNMTGGEIFGGVIGELIIADEATASITGGYIHGLVMRGPSTLTIGGEARVDSLSLGYGGRAVIEGNPTIGGVLLNTTTCDLSIHGGSFWGMYATGLRPLTISAGRFDLTPLDIHTAGRNRITGGVFGADVSLSTSLEVSGGLFSGNLVATGNSSLTFVGDDFAINGIPVEQVGDDYGMTEFLYNGFIPMQTGILTGTLADGSPINETLIIDRSDVPYGNADLHFIPEPTGLTIVALGGAWLMRRRWA